MNKQSSVFQNFLVLGILFCLPFVTRLVEVESIHSLQKSEVFRLLYVNTFKKSWLWQEISQAALYWDGELARWLHCRSVF